jgi:alpha-galactosidase
MTGSSASARTSSAVELGQLAHLRAGGVSLIVDARGPRLPRVIYWGCDLGEISGEVLESLVTVGVAPRVSSVPDDDIVLGVLAEHALGWPGQPGLTAMPGS